jgi:hypothetical protein
VVTQLTLAGERLDTTPEHPFFVVGRGWVAAGDVRAGERVRQADGGSGMVTAVATAQRPQLMYNLTVDVAHTFFVGDGQWLVHNTCKPVQPHPNARSSANLNHVYEITMTDNTTGVTSVYKYGVSNRPLNPDFTSPRAMEQVEGWNRVKHGRITYQSRTLAYNIRGRDLALKMEQGLVDTHARNNSRGYYGPPGNKRPKPTPR